MNQRIAPELPLITRKSLACGPIFNPSHPDQKYGVIFLTSEPEDPPQLTPEELMGATVFNPDAVNSSAPFTVLGGYYCTKSRKDGQKLAHISRIFGVATEPAKGFNLQEGNTRIADEWGLDLLDPSDSRFHERIDEQRLGESGWTLIVEFAPARSAYPFCHRPVELYKSCPELEGISLHVLEELERSLTVRVEAQVTGGAFDDFNWKWGDGEEETTASGIATHTFDRVQGTDVTRLIELTARRAGSCEATATKEVLVEKFCLQMRVKEQQLTLLSHSEAQLSLRMQVRNGPADRYEWDWGDGSPLQTTTEPEAQHIYGRTTEGSQSRTVQIKAIGPGSCIFLKTTQVEIPARPCPVITQLEASAPTAGSPGQFEVRFAATQDKGSHETFVWDFGDGTDRLETAQPEVIHTYAAQPGLRNTYQVSVQGKGPHACESQAQTSVFIAGSCPVIDSIEWQVVNQTETAFTIRAEAKVAGPSPTSFEWVWGDGQTETTTAASAEHTYTRPAGDAWELSLLIRTEGPSDCQSSEKSTPLSIPGVCPVIQSIDWTVTETQGDRHLVEAEVNILGPTPDRISWKWAESQEEVETESPNASHWYGVPFGAEETHILLVTLHGPGSCQTQGSVPIKLATPCQTSLRIGYSLIEQNGLLQDVRFEVGVEGPTPESFTWNWGDGSEEETSPDTQISHTFPLPIGEPQTYTVRVQGNGPGKCQPHAEIQLWMDIVCPELRAIYLEKTETSAETVTVRAIADVLPVPADSYVWHWGDESAPETTTSPEATHVFTRNWGDARTHTVKVQIQGPGTCSDDASAGITIEGRCPLIMGIGLETTNEDPVTQTFSFDIEMPDAPDAAVLSRWHWDDGSPVEEISGLTAAHTFPRQKGGGAPYKVQVVVLGPGSCMAAYGIEVSPKPGESCPVLSRINVYVADENDTEITYAFAPVLTHGRPDSYEWNWGEGATSTVSDPVAYHTFNKGVSESSLTVSVETTGPDECESSGEVEVIIPAGEASCPVIKDIHLGEAIPIGNDQWQLTARAEFEGPKPDTFHWNWAGRDKALVSQGPEVELTFNRKKEDQLLTLTLSTQGPGSCMGSTAKKVEIPGIPALPPWCQILPYLLAFLGALATGAVYVGLTGRFADSITPGQGGFLTLFSLLSVGAFLGVAALAIWGKCPFGRCNWLAVGWASAISGLTLTFFMLGCFNWIPLAIGYFVIAGILLYFWFKDCGSRIEALVFFLFLLMSLLGATIDALVVAKPALLCC